MSRWIIALAAALVSGTCSRATSVPPTTSSDPPSGLFLPWTAESCAGERPDADADGLGERCELDLARGFAPELVVYGGGCNWDASVAPARPGGGYHFAVQPVPGAERVRIAYLPAYYRDCGWRGAKCALPFVDCAPHAGDSEALVLDAVFDAATRRWRTERIFLSAHCFGRGADGCRWFAGADLAAFEWVEGERQGAPVVWVAEGRHANYPTQSACDRGHFFIDTCDRNGVRVRFPIASPGQNIGSRARPAGDEGGCVGPDRGGWVSRLVALDRKECFWSPTARFTGWSAGGSEPGSTPYFRYLDEVAGF